MSATTRLCVSVGIVIGSVLFAVNPSDAAVIARWRFEPGAGFLLDSSGNGHDLQAYGVAPGSSGDVANADGGLGSASFDGTSQALRTVNTLDLSAYDNLRVSFAMRSLDEPDGLGTVVEHSLNQNFNNGAFLIDTNELDPGVGTATLKMAGAGLASHNIDQLPHAIDGATWDLFDIWYEPAAADAADVVRIRRNGVTLPDSIGWDRHGTDEAPFLNDFLYIGARGQGGGQNFFQGNIDELTISTVIPEPSMCAIACLLGAIGLGYGWRRKRVGRCVSVGLFLLVSGCLFAGSTSAAPILLTGYDQFPAPGGTDRIRPDLANAFDGDLNTDSYLTTARTHYTDHRKQRVAMSFDATDVNRLRVSKYGDVIWDDDLPAYPVDLAVYSTTDSTATPLENRAWSRVGRMTNGYNNGATTVEQIDATAVQRSGSVFEDVDNKGGPEHPGYPEFYSLTFDTVANATGLMIEFNASPSRAASIPWNHYRAREIEAHYDTDAVLALPVLFGQVVNADIQYTGGEAYTGDSPIQTSPTWNHVAVDNVVDLVDSNNQPTSVDLSLFNANGRWDSTWSNHDLLEDYLYRDTAGWANAQISGLNDDKQYNVYVYTGVEGGRYRIGDLIQDAIYAGTGSGGDPDYNPGPSGMADFVNGKNFVVFEDIAPSNGEILVQYRGIAGAGMPGYANFAGVTVAEVTAIIPEPSSLVVLGGLGVLGMAAYGWRRRRPARQPG